MTNHILLVFRKDTIYFPTPNPPNAFSYAYCPGPGPIPGAYPAYPTSSIPPVHSQAHSQNQNNTDSGTGLGNGLGTVNETFHLLNERGLPISPTSPILSTQAQAQTQTQAQIQRQGNAVAAPLLLVAVTEAMRANESFFSGFEYLSSWMADDYRHYYVILERKTVCTTNGDNRGNDKGKNGDTPSSPVNTNTRDTRDTSKDTTRDTTRDTSKDTKNEGNTTSNDTNEWGTANTTTNDTTNDSKPTVTNEWSTNEGTTTTAAAAAAANDNEWNTNEGNTTNPTEIVPTSNDTKADEWTWSTPPDPISDSNSPPLFTVRDWARSPSPPGTDTGTGTGTGWRDTTPSSSW